MTGEFLPGRVPAEPGNGAQPPGDGGPGAAAGFQITGVTPDAGAAGTGQAQLMLLAPAGELPQVQLVRLAGQPAVPGEEPSQCQPLRVREDGRDRDQSSGRVVVAIRHLPGAQAETPKLGQPRPQQDNKNPTVNQPRQSRQVTARPRANLIDQPDGRSRAPIPSARRAPVAATRVCADRPVQRIGIWGAGKRLVTWSWAACASTRGDGPGPRQGPRPSADRPARAG